MTADDFTAAARAEAEGRWWNGAVPRDINPNQAWILGFREGAPWARDHLAAQEPTDAEVEAALNADRAYVSGHGELPLDAYGELDIEAMRRALAAARAVRQEKR